MTKNIIESTYIKLSPIEHVLKKPGMYVGDLEFRTEMQYIVKDMKITMEEISWSPGLYKIIDELIVNCYDQNIRDKTLTNINIDITPEQFSIFNDGVGIDVVKHKEYNVWVPELIFANLLTSTNYSDTEERIVGGTHGLGAKLSAIFSKKFIIEVWDSKRKKYYKQIIENNLSKISKPDISDTTNIKGGVKITIFPDFEKFKTERFSSDMIKLLEKRAFDLIGLVRNTVSVTLNNIKLPLSTFENYLSLYQGENKWYSCYCVKNPLWSFGIKINNINTITSNTITSNISFVNGVYTNRGGKHVEYIMDILVEKFKKIVSPEFTKKILNDNITLCLKTSIINPTFGSQSKEELNTPVSRFGFECNIPESFYIELKTDGIIDIFKNIIMLSNQKILSKLESNKVNRIKNIPKLDDANFAGTKKSLECTLILTEGDSAKATAISGISAVPNGRNIYGVYPLRGKLLNVREASTSQIANNIEITELKKILALKSGVTYNNSNINELRYGSILIMTDADEDGSHIKGLIINFFDYFFPSLLAIEGFIKILVTPLIKATKLNNIISFANLRAYNVWKEKADSGWKIKYYKGLGTSTSKEAGEYFQKINENTIKIVNKNDNIDILLAFAKDKVMDRKTWLNNYDPNKILELEPPTTITIKQFIHQELIHFSNYDNIRSIPMLSDGLKPSQRKVLYACIKQNVYKETKVAQLAASVAADTAYHHGEQSLVSTIINMAQNFVGANNLNLLVPQGQLGTRLLGGKDHSSARYIYTYLENYVPLIFKKEDMELLEYLEDDGIKIEPRFFLPTIPLILVNGSEGIGTGFSTFIPNHNIKDIITWLICKLSGKKTEKILPWYKNHNGNIIPYDIMTYVSSGKIELDLDKNQVVITELPIKFWTNDYKEFLEELIYNVTSNVRLFKSYVNLSSDQTILFILKFDSDMKEKIKLMYENIDEDKLNQMYKYLRLYKTIKLSNMNLYTMNYNISIFKTCEEIMETFYKWRLDFYELRKTLLLKKLKEEILLYDNMIKFIKLVKTKQDIFNLDSNEMIKYLKNNKLDIINDSYNYLTDMTFKQLTRSNLDKLEMKIKELKKEYKLLEIKSKKELWLEDLNLIKLNIKPF
jgi:DNA topoisomerase-2